MVDVTPEPTPNPNALKFSLDRPATERRSETFRAGSDPADSPLGARVFALDGVTNVFLASNFVSVTKSDEADWDTLAPAVVDEIRAHFGGE
jgi:Scaffold protein Nfu/NifU N terminal